MSENIHALLARLRAAGVVLQAQGDRLAYDGRVSDEDLDLLAARKPEILAALRTARPAREARPGRPASRTAPQPVAFTPPASIAATVETLVARLDEGPAERFPTGLAGLDRKLGGGLRRGRLYVIGARTGVGKSILVLQIARAVAARGVAVWIVSREMAADEVALRALAQVSEVPTGRLEAGRLDGRERQARDAAVAGLGHVPLYLDDRTLDLPTLAAGLATWRPTPPLAVLIVDYLQLLRAPREIRDRRLQVEAISSGLKGLALDHQVAILAVSSLNRPADRKEATPDLWSLRESGEIEYDADAVLLLHLPDPSGDAPFVEWGLAKHRHGPAGTGAWRFRKALLRFEEPTLREPGEDG